MDIKNKDTNWPSAITAGLDMGSRAVKLVVAGPEGIVKSRVFEAVPFLLGLRQNGGLDREALGLEPQWPLVLTGYGRSAAPAEASVTEIRAHFKGALAQTGLKDFTLVELGGQDSKVVQVEGGRPLDFLTNDRCAAGTGRYLENMARLLGVEVAELAAARGQPVEINNTCATFGETEVLGRLAQGAPLAAIMAGVNFSVARRAAQMIRRYKPRSIVLAGGVALNAGVVRSLGELTGCEIITPPYPQLNGALGCCMEQELI